MIPFTQGFPLKGHVLSRLLKRETICLGSLENPRHARQLRALGGTRIGLRPRGSSSGYPARPRGKTCPSRKLPKLQSPKRLSLESKWPWNIELSHLLGLPENGSQYRFLNQVQVVPPQLH